MRIVVPDEIKRLEDVFLQYGAYCEGAGWKLKEDAPDDAVAAYSEYRAWFQEMHKKYKE